MVTSPAKSRHCLIGLVSATEKKNITRSGARNPFNPRQGKGSINYDERTRIVLLYARGKTKTSKPVLFFSAAMSTLEN